MQNPRHQPFHPQPPRHYQPTLRKGSVLKATACVGGDWRSIWALGECVGSSSDPLFRSSKRGEQGLTMSRSICSRLSCRPPREISATLGTRRETPREARPARDLGRELARRLAGKLFVLHLHRASGEGVDGGGWGWQAGGRGSAPSVTPGSGLQEVWGRCYHGLSDILLPTWAGHLLDPEPGDYRAWKPSKRSCNSPCPTAETLLTVGSHY